MTYSSVYLIVDPPPKLDDINPELYSEWIGAFKETCQDCSVQVITTEKGVSRVKTADRLDSGPDALVCPLMLSVPDRLHFPERSVYERCGNVDALRGHVYTQWGYASATGDHWLPIVLTAKGPLYGEVIGCPPMAMDPAKVYTQPYQQPIHLSDQWRQPLYRLGYHLLTLLEATPGVYLLQFSLENDTLLFDRLWPFPHYPALASVGIQSPNLFECHWRCLMNQPILDLTIEPGLG